MIGDKTLEPFVGPKLEGVGTEGYSTPGFGSIVPDFGAVSDVAQEVIQSFGAGRVLVETGEEWPRLPVCVLSEPIKESLLVGE